MVDNYFQLCFMDSGQFVGNISLVLEVRMGICGPKTPFCNYYASKTGGRMPQLFLSTVKVRATEMINGKVELRWSKYRVRKNIFMISVLPMHQLLGAAVEI